MAFIKGFLFFIIMVLLVYGVTGLTAKESIVFTAFGFGISAILCSFVGIMVVLVVTMCLFAFEELGALPREGANKWGNSSRLTQSFHFFMFEPIFSPVNALNQPI